MKPAQGILKLHDVKKNKDKVLGSGRKSEYHGSFKNWPRVGRRFVFERNDRVFKTSTVVSINTPKKDPNVRVFQTKHGTVYRVSKNQ